MLYDTIILAMHLGLIVFAHCRSQAAEWPFITCSKGQNAQRKALCC